MMITVHYRSDKGNHHRQFSTPLGAVQFMGDIELYENLTPAGWTCDKLDEQSAVLRIRKGRDFLDVTGAAEQTSRCQHCERTIYVYPATRTRQINRDGRGPWRTDVWDETGRCLVAEEVTATLAGHEPTESALGVS